VIGTGSEGYAALVGIIAIGVDGDGILAFKGLIDVCSVYDQTVHPGISKHDQSGNVDPTALDVATQSGRLARSEYQVPRGPVRIVDRHRGQHRVKISPLSAYHRVVSRLQRPIVSAITGIGQTRSQPIGMVLLDNDFGFQGLICDGILYDAGKHRAGGHVGGIWQSPVEQPAHSIAAALDGVDHQKAVRLEIAGAALDQDLDGAVLLIHPVVESAFATEIGQRFIGGPTSFLGDLGRYSGRDGSSLIDVRRGAHLFPIEGIVAFLAEVAGAGGMPDDGIDKPVLLRQVIDCLHFAFAHGSGAPVIIPHFQATWLHEGIALHPVEAEITVDIHSVDVVSHQIAVVKNTVVVIVALVFTV